MNVLGLITARGGSKGIPRKNLVPMHGKPLIAWTVEAALKSSNLNRVIVSTDNEEIADYCRSLGVEVPFLRPAEISGDSAPHIDVVRHALQWLEKHSGYVPDYVSLLQPTSPLRSAYDIDESIRLAYEHKVEAVVSVVEVDRHPYFIKKILPNGRLGDYIQMEIAYPRRQDLPPAYAINGAIFLNSRSSLLKDVKDKIFYPDGSLPYIMPAKRSVEIDTLFDLKIAECTIENS